MERPHQRQENTGGASSSRRREGFTGSVTTTFEQAATVFMAARGIMLTLGRETVDVKMRTLTQEEAVSPTGVRDGIRLTYTAPSEQVLRTYERLVTDTREAQGRTVRPVRPGNHPYR